MTEIVALNATSATEEQRQRFEAWAKSGMTGPREASTLLARSRGGDYVQAATRAAWAAWQAAIQDLIELYEAEKRPKAGWYLCNDFYKTAVFCGDEFMARVALTQKSGPIRGDTNGYYIEERHTAPTTSTPNN